MVSCSFFMACSKQFLSTAEDSLHESQFEDISCVLCYQVDFDLVI